MELEELKKYIDFELVEADKLTEEDKEQMLESHKMAMERWGKICTLVIGHQPRILTEEESADLAKKNIHTKIDVNDEYWTDDIIEVFKIPKDVLGEQISRDYSTIYDTRIEIAGRTFGIIIEDMDGFIAGYGSPEIYEWVNKTE